MMKCKCTKRSRSVVAFGERRYSALLVLVGLVVASAGGCSQESQTVDTAPFREAIKEYLQVGNMALAIKDIKQGPTVTGDSAQLSASLTHQELGGASVTWTFYFERQPDGSWSAVRHED